MIQTSDNESTHGTDNESVVAFGSWWSHCHHAARSNDKVDWCPFVLNAFWYFRFKLLSLIIVEENVCKFFTWIPAWEHKKKSYKYGWVIVLSTTVPEGTLPALPFFSKNKYLYLISRRFIFDLK